MNVERKLAAFLSADVKGYGRLMEDDEQATVACLTEYRDYMSGEVKAHRGRVVDAVGDNLLAEFHSVVDAVEAAMAIQEELARRNAGLPPERQMLFRIGINMGDVLTDGERVYGDGVNIAARLEGLADPGGVAVSGAAYDQIRTELSQRFVYCGERTLKNVAEPIRVYRALVADLTPNCGPTRLLGLDRRLFALILALLLASLGWWGWEMFGPDQAPPPRQAVSSTTAGSLPAPPSGRRLVRPDKPSLVVMPFKNLGGGETAELFSTGITEDLITDLSKVSELFVIARDTSFAYKNRDPSLESVSRELGVRYILEGSVRTSDDRIRITAQLIDAETGYHLWADRYDGLASDIFTFQDQVTKQIVKALEIKLSIGEDRLLGDRPTVNMVAYENVLRGQTLRARYSRNANLKARGMFHQALDLDPKYAAAYVGLGQTYLDSWTAAWSDDRSVLKRAADYADKALKLDPNLTSACVLRGRVALWRKNYAQSIQWAEQAAKQSPNNPEALSLLAMTLAFSGNPALALTYAQQAARLNPRQQAFHSFHLGHIYGLLGRFDQAILELERAVALNPDFLPARAYLACALAAAGKVERARSQAEELKRREPGFDVKTIAARMPYKDGRIAEHFLAHLKAAGLG